MYDACTVIMQDRSYCLEGRYAQVIRDASIAGAEQILVRTTCSCGDAHSHEINLILRDVVDVVDHGSPPPVTLNAYESKVIAFPRR